jgi:hypothetical protein
MEKLGTWLGITGVAIGFILLLVVLFAEGKDQKNQKKK